MGFGAIKEQVRQGIIARCRRKRRQAEGVPDSSTLAATLFATTLFAATLFATTLASDRGAL